MGNTCYYSIQNNNEMNIIENYQLSRKTTNTVSFQRNILNPQQLYSQNKTSLKVPIQQKSRMKMLSNEKQLQKGIEQLYKRCKKYYNEHYIDSASFYADEILKLIKQAHSKNILYELNQQKNQTLKLVKMQHQDVIFYEKQIDKGGWQLKQDKEGIKISCRRQNDGTVGCRIETVTDVPFEVLISVMIQIQYYKDYTPFLEISRAQKEVARNCRLGYTLNSIPFFTKRQAYFQGIGYSRLNTDRQQLFLFTRSLHDKEHLQTLLEFPIEINQNYIQLDYKYFVVRYRPIKKNLGRIDIGMNVDVKMDYIPTWLMEKVSIDFGEKFFKNILKISKNFKGSKWEKNVQKNPDLFLYFQKQVQNYLAGKQSN